MKHCQPMTNASFVHHVRRSLFPKALFLALACAFASSATSAQAPPTPPDQLAKAIAALNAGDFLGEHIDAVYRAKAGAQVLPALEQQFKRATEADKKAQVAEALVRLGDKDDLYWNYLLAEATAVVDSAIPDPFFLEPNGTRNIRKFSLEIEAWGRAHNLDPNSAAILALYEYPGKLFILGYTGDARGVPLLRRALRSSDSMIVTIAAKGLAQIHDKASIPFIIAAARSALAGLAPSIAESLVYFDNPDAQSTVDRYMTSEYAKDLRESRAQGMGPFGWQ